MYGMYGSVFNIACYLNKLPSRNRYGRRSDVSTRPQISCLLSNKLAEKRSAVTVTVPHSSALNNNNPCSNSHEVREARISSKEPLGNGLKKPYLWQGSKLELCKLKSFPLLWRSHTSYFGVGFQLRELENLPLEVDGRWVGFEFDGESKLIEEVTIARGQTTNSFFFSWLFVWAFYKSGSNGVGWDCLWRVKVSQAQKSLQMSSTNTVDNQLHILRKKEKVTEQDCESLWPDLRFAAWAELPRRSLWCSKFSMLTIKHIPRG